MATLDQQPAPDLTEAPVTGVQPGAGFCAAVELAWGRLRRAWLRRFRPAYVRRMASVRQGACPACPHDILDPRDLKYVANVCGYWFRPEDDPFRWRDRLGVARIGLVEIILFSLLLGTVSLGLLTAGALVHWTLWLPLIVVAALWFEVIFFFRNPERSIPADAVALVSPADGTVTHVGQVEEPDFPGGRAFRVSIFLSVFNVHINRAPRAGRVVRVRYFPGTFLDARSAECPSCNEQLWLDLEEEDTSRPLRVKQIAGKLARRIVCRLKPGDVVQKGERYGMIKFGSRTDVLIPSGDAIDVRVKVGDRVKGGATVLVRFAEASVRR